VKTSQKQELQPNNEVLETTTTTQLTTTTTAAPGETPGRSGTVSITADMEIRIDYTV
jgi:hypothetical protein